MARSFLIGKFLPAYSSRFGRLPDREMTSEGLPADVLKARFAERGLQYVRWRREYLMMGQVGVILALTLSIGAFRVNFTGGETLEYVMPD